MRFAYPSITQRPVLTARVMGYVSGIYIYPR